MQARRTDLLAVHRAARGAPTCSRCTELLAALEESPWAATAIPSTLYHDPPWTIPFLRRNEVVALVEERGR